MVEKIIVEQLIDHLNWLYNKAGKRLHITGGATGLSFSGANVSYSVLQGTFTNCDFSDANLLMADTSTATFVDCNFKGVHNFRKKK